MILVYDFIANGSSSFLTKGNSLDMGLKKTIFKAPHFQNPSLLWISN